MSQILEIRKRAHEYVQSGDLDLALEEYRKLLKGDAVDPNVFNLMGDVCYKKGEKDEAFQQYREAVKAYRSEGLYSNAIAVCRKMTRMDPNCADVSFLMAQLYQDQGFASEAAAYFLEFAERLIATHDLVRASEILKQVIEAAPARVKVREQLADVYSNLGMMDEARSELLAASEIHAQKGDQEKAAALRLKAQEIKGGGSDSAAEAQVEGEGTDRVEIVHKRIGLAHHVPIKIDDVLRSFKDEVQRAIGEEDYQSHYDLGMAYLDMGLTDEALAEFSVAQRQPELKLRSIEMAGRCFMERNDIELAIQELSAGLEIEGYSQAEYLGLRYNLAMAYEKLGSIDEAVEHYTEICKTDPGFRDAQVRLEELRRTK
ncbi:MAG TPA: tetratricopeptide repeat protein [bacterium]|nr:tetratricopeptide repeat protein [bacterium]